jgi:uncharacterized peroxidase-related enzyme
MFIDTVKPDDARGLLAEIYQSEIDRRGFLPEFVQCFSHHPEAYQAWSRLIEALFHGMDRRRCELATLTAARTMRSTCCTIAHGRALRERFFSSDEVVQIMRDHRDAGLEEVEVAIMDFAEKSATDPSSITREDVDHLKSLGLSDREVFDVVFAVAARAFLTTVIESLGAKAESPWVNDLEPELVDVLTVGRPAT